MDSVIPTPMELQTKDVWPWSLNATTATGLIVAFWLGVLCGFFGVKGGLL